MKKLTLLIGLMLYAAFAFTQNCNSETKNTNLAASLAYGQQTNDYDCWRQDANTAISRLVALLQQSNPTTTILDIAQNSDLTLDQRLNQICDIFSGVSKDPFQTQQGPSFRLDANLQGAMIVVCEVISGLLDESISIGKEQTVFVQHSNIFYITDSVRYDFQKIGSRILLEYSIQVRNISKAQISLKFELPSNLIGKRFTVVSTMVNNINVFEPVATIVRPNSAFIDFKRINNLKWGAANGIINLTGQIWLST